MAPLFRIEFGPTPPLHRAWFLSPDGSRLVQLQQDRLVHNWRYQGEPYPRFEPLAEAFQGYQKSFFGLLETLRLPVPRVEQVEVTYINWIPASWMNEVVTFVTTPSLPNGLGTPDSGALSKRFLVVDEGSPVGRLYLEARSAVSQESGALEAGFLLNLTFRAPHQGVDDPGETTRLMLRGREAIVQAFTASRPKTSTRLGSANNEHARRTSSSRATPTHRTDSCRPARPTGADGEGACAGVSRTALAP